MVNIERMKDELRRDEGERLRPYRCTAGKLTIGVGRNLDDVGISREESDYLLENDIGRVMAELDRALPWWRDLSEARARAVVNMGFNLGVPRLMQFRRMLSSLRDGDYSGAAAEALSSAWAGQVGARADRIAAMLREG